MTPLRRSVSVVLVLMSTLAAACGVREVNSYSDRGFDVARYRTYAWAAEAPRPTGDPRLDNNQILRSRVETDIDKELASHGFEKTLVEAPDLLVRYFASVTQELDTTRDDRACTGCVSEVYDAGTLTIDLVDARSGRLLWRGWAQGSVEGMVDEQRWFEALVGQAVTRILKTLPRRP